MAPLKSSAHDAGDPALADTGYTIPPSAWRVRDMPLRVRPREELDRLGVSNVSDAVLLALLLRTGAKGLNVVDLAYGLLRRYGSLSELAAASVDELCALRGVGRTKAQIVRAALELGRRLVQEGEPARVQIRTPEDVSQLLREDVRLLDQEQFWVLHLDTKHRLKVRPRNVTSGLVDASLVHPREVFRGAVRASTAAVVLAHNHPSGDPAPSAEDVRITRQLVEAGRIMDIKVLDHVILGRANGRTSQAAFVSMRESGVVAFE